MPTDDVVVIGSGVAGLTAACLLAARGRRVTVLEQHVIPGGLLQRYRRKGVMLDTGFHYVGGAGPGGPLRRYLAHLGILDRLRLTPFDADGFDEIVLPDRRFALPTGMDRLRARLCETFPDDAAGIRRVLDSIADYTLEHPLFAFASEQFEPLLRIDGPPVSVAEHVDAHVEADAPAAILSAHAIHYGVPAARASMRSHALVMSSFVHSCHGLPGGGDELSGALVDRLEELGGRLRLRTDATRIDVRAGRVRAVETRRGGTFRCDEVISAVHPGITLDLVGEAHVKRRFVRRIRAIRNSPSALLVHVAVRGREPVEPRRNWHWLGPSPRGWREETNWFDTGDPPPAAALLTGPPAPERPGDTLLQVMAPLRIADLGDLGDRAAFRHRKLGVAERLVPIVEECVPGSRGRVEILDVSTPLAFRHFVRAPEGSCYGAEVAVDQQRGGSLGLRLGIDGLRSAGQSVGLPGVLGCMAGATAAAFGSGDELSAVYRELRSADGRALGEDGESQGNAPDEPMDQRRTNER